MRQAFQGKRAHELAPLQSEPCPQFAEGHEATAPEDAHDQQRSFNTPRPDRAALQQIGKIHGTGALEVDSA